MAVTTFDRAAHATRCAATAATPAKIIGSVAVAGWVGVAANRAHLLGNPMPVEWLVIALSALITASIGLIVWSRFGNGLLYSIFCAGRAAEREAQRREQGGARADRR